MPGRGHMMIGAVALVAGAALALLSLQAGALVSLVAYAAIAVAGVGEIVLGVTRWQTHRVKVRRLHHAHRSRTDIDLLLRAMVAVAAADRHLAGNELAMIEDVSAGLLGAPVPRARIERVQRRMQGKDPVEQIARLALDASPEGVEMAVKGAVWAGRADGALSEAEMQVIDALAAAMGVSGHRLRTCIAEADHVHERLAQAGPA